MNSVVSGLSTFGRINAVIGCVITTIIAIVMIVVSINLLRAPIRNTKTMGKVVSVGEKGTVKASYTVGGQTYFVSGSSNDAVGNDIDIMYDNNNPGDSRLSNQISNKSLAKILIGITLIVVILTYVTTYFTFKSKTFAAFQGGTELVGDIGRNM